MSGLKKSFLIQKKSFKIVPNLRYFQMAADLKGITHLAKYLVMETGYSKGMISEVLNGKKEPSGEFIAKTALALGLSLQNHEWIRLWDMVEILPDKRHENYVKFEEKFIEDFA